MLSAPLFNSNPQLLADLTLQGRLPAINIFPDFARKGGLMAYGPEFQSLFMQAGVMTRKALQGAAPADFPVERPVRFKLVVNLKAARALNLTLPTSVLLSVDESDRIRRATSSVGRFCCESLFGVLIKNFWSRWCVLCAATWGTISLVPKSTTDFRRGAEKRRSNREVQRSTFARFLELFDFRLLQYRGVQRTCRAGRNTSEFDPNRFLRGSMRSLPAFFPFGRG